METYRTQSIDVLKSRRESIVYQIKNLQNVIHEWELKAMDLSQKLAEYDRIQSKLDRDHNSYNQLISTIQSVAVESKASLGKIVLGGFFTGLLVGLAILFAIDKLDDRVSSLIECKGSFKELSVLGQIPSDGMADEMTRLSRGTFLWDFPQGSLRGV